MDPRERYLPEVEAIHDSKNQRGNVFGHLFMFTLLLLIVLLYVKNNYFLYTADGQILTYLIALALPVLLLVIFGGVVVYQRYIVKLEESHRSIHIWLVSLLVLVSLAIVAFAVLISFYF